MGVTEVLDDDVESVRLGAEQSRDDLDPVSILAPEFTSVEVLVKSQYVTPKLSALDTSRGSPWRVVIKDDHLVLKFRQGSVCQCTLIVKDGEAQVWRWVTWDRLSLHLRK